MRRVKVSYSCLLILLLPLLALSAEEPAFNAGSELKARNLTSGELPPELLNQEPFAVPTNNEEFVEKPKDPIPFLKRFVGTWSGEVLLQTMRGDKLNVFEVEQQYWWNEEKNTLEGLAVFDAAGILRYAQSSHFIKNGFVYTIVDESGQKSRYKGKIGQDSITWYPVEQARTFDHQLTESFVMTDDGLVIRKDGFERYNRGRINMMILISGDLHLQKPKSDQEDEIGEANF